jgi:peptide/nickel transport system substrate-binding protein
MRSALPRLFALLLTCAVFAGCGSGRDEDGDGNTLRGSYGSFPESLDPSLSFSLEGATALQNVYLPPLTYAHADGTAGTRLIPALAKGLPRVDKGGRQYTLFLRPGLRYSDGTRVLASDFRFAIERLFRLNSLGSTFYTGIVGASRFAKTKKGRITGIVTDDRSGKITIRLVRPSGFFPYLLALPFAAPLPPETPASDQTADPPPATGPYEITEVDTGRSWEYSRNPVWKSGNGEAMPDLPDGHVDAISFEVRRNAVTQVTEVERGEMDWMKNPPPPDVYAEVKQRFEGSQFKEAPFISVFYFWMNTQEPPFDDVRVRRAVNYAVDPEVLQRLYTGTLAPTQQILPPGMPGYRKFEPYPHNPARARRLIAEAAPADREITVWTNNQPPNREAGEYYQQVLLGLGFEAALKTVDVSAYFTVISNGATPDLDTGWANWLLDYPHPNDYFQPQLASSSILPAGNSNWAHFADPATDREIERLGAQPLGPATTAAYASLDRAVMEQAPWAPFGNLTLGTFVSESIDLEELIISPVFGQDLTSFRFR